MTASFRNSLPAELVKNTIALCDETGEQWLDNLPELIATLENRWRIKVHKHFDNLSFNFVATASDAAGNSTVLKIGPPLNNIEIFGEAKFLRIYDGEGCVELLREDHELQAILIERAVPGEYLTMIFTGREKEAVAPAIDVLRRLLRPPPVDRSDVILLDHWFDGMRRYEGTKFPSEYARRAMEIYETLAPQPGRTFYLHGDFHHENILSATRTPYLVIDPKGIIGHIGYEIAVFLNNHHWWQDRKSDICERLSLAVNQFSDAFAMDRKELRQWAFAQMVLSAWWTFDEMPDIYSNEVAMADIWDV